MNTRGGGAAAAASFDERLSYRGADGAALGWRCRPAQRLPAAMPLVMLHGAASNATRWWHFTDHSSLHDRRILAPDLRGHGGSLWRGPARMRHWVADLVALLDQADVPRAIVGGHCLGANLALHFAAAHPERCAGLVLIEPMLREALTGQMAWLRRLSPLLNAGAVLVGGMNALGIHRRRLKQVDLRELDRPVHASAAAGGEPELKVHGSLRHDAGVLPIAQLLGNFVEIARPLPLAQVRAPSLVIQASGRRMTDAVLTREIFARALPDASFVELPSEHWIPTTHPERLCALIDEWVSVR